MDLFTLAYGLTRLGFTLPTSDFAHLGSFALFRSSLCSDFFHADLWAILCGLLVVTFGHFDCRVLVAFEILRASRFDHVAFRYAKT